MVGLSDEAGAGANVGLAAKALHAPTALEIKRVDDYIHKTLWGIKQDIPYSMSLQDHATGGIRASLFWVPTPVSPQQHLAYACQRGVKSCHPESSGEMHGYLLDISPYQVAGYRYDPLQDLIHLRFARC